jgi:hypothetical protein
MNDPLNATPPTLRWGRIGALVGAVATLPFVWWFGTLVSGLAILAGAAVGWGIGYLAALISADE